jgi:hypothetical protein
MNCARWELCQKMWYSIPLGKTKRGITRTPLRFGKLVGRSTAKRSVIGGQ